MARDFEPPVRERDAAAAPTRRNSRRDPAPPDQPELALETPDQAPASRVARDEHRPRRGTLPDRRLLRRDTPIDYAALAAEQTEETPPEARSTTRTGDSKSPTRDPRPDTPTRPDAPRAPRPTDEQSPVLRRPSTPPTTPPRESDSESAAREHARRMAAVRRAQEELRNDLPTREHTPDTHPPRFRPAETGSDRVAGTRPTREGAAEPHTPRGRTSDRAAEPRRGHEPSSEHPPEIRTRSASPDSAEAGTQSASVNELPYEPTPGAGSAPRGRPVETSSVEPVQTRSPRGTSVEPGTGIDPAIEAGTGTGPMAEAPPENMPAGEARAVLGRPDEMRPGQLDAVDVRSSRGTSAEASSGSGPAVEVRPEPGTGGQGRAVRGRSGETPSAREALVGPGTDTGTAVDAELEQGEARRERAARSLSIDVASGDEAPAEARTPRETSVETRPEQTPSEQGRSVEKRSAGEAAVEAVTGVDPDFEALAGLSRAEEAGARGASVVETGLGAAGEARVGPGRTVEKRSERSVAVPSDSGAEVTGAAGSGGGRTDTPSPREASEGLGRKASAEARGRGAERVEGERMLRRRRRESDPLAGESQSGAEGAGRERVRGGEPRVERDGRRGEEIDGRGRAVRGGEGSGRERRAEGEREVLRGNGSDGRKRRGDAERTHASSRAGSAGNARRRSEDEAAGERAGRGRSARGRRTEQVDRQRKTGRKGKANRDLSNAGGEAAREAKPVKAAKKKQTGPKLLDDSTRAKLEVTAREGNGIRAALATFRLHTDELRRRNFAARVERIQYGSFDEFDRTTAQLTDRGYMGAGGGRMSVVGRPVEYRATTAQVAGLWPWSVGAGAPLIGTPLGSHLHTGAPVCFDPMNWFMRGSFITAPSLFVLGLNGFGKSSLVRRIVLGGVAQGITPLILADVKPDYRKLVELVDGQVIDLGYGHGKLNPLAAGVLGSIVPRLNELPELQVQVLQDLRARQVTLVAGLVELVRGARVRDYEETLIATGLRILYRDGSRFTPDQPPIMEDLLTVIVEGGDELQLDAGADNPEEYQNAIKGLRRSLRALTQGPFGAIFNGHTTTPIDTTATAVCIDVSHIPQGDRKLKAAVMLACWADGFASVEAAHVLADADLGPQRYFQVVMDELWQVLGLGDFMVDRVDELTRLQRGIATALIMISHTIKDLQALGSEAAIAKALGFLERARAKIFGALPAEEISRLDSTVPFTSAEEDMVTSWSAPQALTGEALKPGQQRPPAPGTGKFLLKIGEDRRPGIPFHMEFTPSEKESGIHDTNQRFSEFTEQTARRGTDEGSAA
ncbi:hypothetical protein AB0N05_10060 [Nocardia sp. NPDC051030]|uniref:hypothetical protein n=1 Tax=Nocardia sp. NPDC051030 TaxID=3155162 RepID=UPI003436BA1E